MYILFLNRQIIVQINLLSFHRVFGHVVVNASVAGSTTGAALPDLLRAAALLAVPARLNLQAPPLPRPQERQTLEVSQFVQNISPHM